MMRSPSSRSWLVLRPCNISATSGKYRASGLPDFDVSVTSSPSRRARQRKPSHLGSNCQPLPAGSSAARSASIGAGTEFVFVTHRQSSAACSRSRCALPCNCYAAVLFVGETNMAFDPNAATARYIDSLGPAALQKAHDYTVGKEWMLLWAVLVAAVVTWLIVKSGALDKLDAKFAEKRRNLRAFVIALVYFIVSAILTLPWTLYSDYFREKAYGRTSQPLADYLFQNGLITIITA